MYIATIAICSQVRVDDGQWHMLVVHRRKRLGVLRVDNERPVKGLAERGSTTLNTNGKLWIGKRMLRTKIAEGALKGSQCMYTSVEVIDR